MATRKTGSRATKRPAPKLKASRPGGASAAGMTVREAGRLGGLIGGRKGGLTVGRERGDELYQEIGKWGGQRVRGLLAAGRPDPARPARARNCRSWRFRGRGQ